MSHQFNKLDNIEQRLAAPDQSVAILRELARRSEAAGFGQQAEFIDAALEALAEPYAGLFHVSSEDWQERVRHLAMVGAPESAVLALMPQGATYSAGRMTDGTIIAQVVLGSDAGDHSRNARWLAMAWLAALLRAVAQVIEICSGPAAHGQTGGQ